MIVSGNQAYIADGLSGLQIVNVSNQFNPALSSSFNDSGYGNYGSVGVTGNSLCASDGNNLKIFDLSQPNELSVPIGQVSGIGAGKVTAANGIAYVRATNGIRLYSLATPSAPQLKYTISNSVVYADDMQILGSTLYLAGRVGSAAPRFVAVDVSNPSSPIVHPSHDFSISSSEAWSLAVNGNKAVVGIFGQTQLRMLDISNLNAPVETWKFNNNISSHKHSNIIRRNLCLCH